MTREEERQALQIRLGQVLSKYGRNAQDGDYYLREEDVGSHELKVQLFADVMTVELVEEVMALLSDVSDEWHVSFVAANLDGTDVIPPAGVKISRFALTGIPEIKYSTEEVSELEALYAAFEKLLSARGKSDPFGKGDYWIVDDGWVRHSHKVCIFDIGFLSPELVTDVQHLLRRDFPACVLWFQIEVSEPGVEIPTTGIRVFADRVEQDWDRGLLRSIFKDRFLW